jgi:hypothetical protein
VSNAILLLALCMIPKEYILITGIFMLCVSIPVLFIFAPVSAVHKPLEETEQAGYTQKIHIYICTEVLLMVILLL